jgi:phosphoribosylformimino-5-aminoimidazole carboxamide ribotide isomerase
LTELFAAVDLLGGLSVRLAQGDFERPSTYGNPVETAVSLASRGAPWVHVVDLDAARTGEPVNRPVVAAIVEAVPVPVQVGGGIRDEAAVESLLGLGAARVVLGTAAVADADLVRRAAEAHPGGVAVGIDHRGGEVAVRGWNAGSGRGIVEVLSGFDSSHVAAFVVTDIGRDGMLTGPDMDGLSRVLASTAVPVVASGGVASAHDVSRLSSLEVSGRRLAGVVVGKALHEGLMTVEEAVAACAP